METLEQKRPLVRPLQHRNAEPIYLIRAFNKQAENFERSRFGWMAILITFQSCLGSVACMYISQSNASVFILGLCAAVTMGCNALFIALAKPKVCLAAFYTSVILNSLLLIMNL